MGVLSQQKGTYAFGPFRLDPARRTLLRGEEPVRLTARLFDTLLYLVENHDRLVEREELQRAIWQGRTVDENSLGQAISALRKALRSAETDESYIITVAGRGYRFGAPVAIKARPSVGFLETPAPPEFSGLSSDSQIAQRELTAPFSHSYWPPRRAAWLAAVFVSLATGFVAWQALRPASHQEPVAALSTRPFAHTPTRNLPAAWTDGHRLHNRRLYIVFGSSANGYTTANADRVDAIVWIDSAGRQVSNYITQADRYCDDAIEYFGEAYGNGAKSEPYAVAAGVTSAWERMGAAEGVAAVSAPHGCIGQLDASTTSHYALSTNPGGINALKITRAFTFIASAAGGDFRPYVVRIPAAAYPDAIYPDSTNTLHIVHAVNCNHNCVVTNWNGKWMADDSGYGEGIAIFRKPNAAFRAEITVDYDDDSRSNASAITLAQPAAGWSGAVVSETEYLCFYDATSWTSAARAAGIPPAGCTDVPH